MKREQVTAGVSTSTYGKLVLIAVGILISNPSFGVFLQSEYPFINMTIQVILVPPSIKHGRVNRRERCPIAHMSEIDMPCECLSLAFLTFLAMILKWNLV